MKKRYCLLILLQTTILHSIVADAQNEAQEPVYQEDLKTRVQNRAGEIEESEVLPRPRIPESLVKSKPVMTLPSSFKSSKRSTVPFNSAGFFAEKPKMLSRTESPLMLSPYFMTSDMIAEWGTVKNSIFRESRIIASVGQNIYIESEKEVAVGTRVFIMRNESSVKFNGPDNEAREGYVYQVLGSARIERLLESENGYVFEAQVIENIQEILDGSIVSLAEPPRMSFKGAPVSQDLTLKVIATDNGKGARELMATSEVVYFNGGRSDGVQLGQVYAIKKGSLEKEGQYKDDSVALARIIFTDDQVSTAVILSSKDGVKVGDRTGAYVAPTQATIDVEKPPVEPISSF